MDSYDTFPEEAQRLFDEAAAQISVLDDPDCVVDDQRWIVRDLVMALLGFGLSGSVIADTIMARCVINDPELVNALTVFTSPSRGT